MPHQVDGGLVGSGVGVCAGGACAAVGGAGGNEEAVAEADVVGCIESSAEGGEAWGEKIVNEFFNFLSFNASVKRVKVLSNRW